MTGPPRLIIHRPTAEAHLFQTVNVRVDDALCVFKNTAADLKHPADTAGSNISNREPCLDPCFDTRQATWI